MGQFIAWNEFRRSHPSRFEVILNRIMKERHISRQDAIDVMDEEWTFELAPDGTIITNEEGTGRYSLIA